MTSTSKMQAAAILAGRRRAQEREEEAERAELADAYRRQRAAQDAAALGRRPSTSSATIIQASRMRETD